MSARYSSPESRWTVSVGDLDPPDQPARPVPGGMSDYASLASAPPPQRPADGAPAPDGGAPAGGADAAPRAAWLPGLSPPARTNQTGPFVPASVPVPAGDMPVGLPAPAQPPVFDVVAGPGHAPAIAPPAPVDVLVDVRVDGPAAPLPPAPAALVPPR
ncbi:MAG: hypothetical protein IRZ08_11710, partial [Frankia sp.]|nr:hypothetical protein [Frankia sp.]